jgi:hypothetical protein
MSYVLVLVLDLLLILSSRVSVSTAMAILASPIE